LFLYPVRFAEKQGWKVLFIDLQIADKPC